MKRDPGDWVSARGEGPCGRKDHSILLRMLIIPASSTHEWWSDTMLQVSSHDTRQGLDGTHELRSCVGLGRLHISSDYP